MSLAEIELDCIETPRAEEQDELRQLFAIIPAPMITIRDNCCVDYESYQEFIRVFKEHGVLWLRAERPYFRVYDFSRKRMMRFIPETIVGIDPEPERQKILREYPNTTFWEEERERLVLIGTWQILQSWKGDAPLFAFRDWDYEREGEIWVDPAPFEEPGINAWRFDILYVTYGNNSRHCMISPWQYELGEAIPETLPEYRKWEGKFRK
jgi:hypothetical protein